MRVICATYTISLLRYITHYPTVLLYLNYSDYHSDVARSTMAVTYMTLVPVRWLLYSE